MKKLVADGKLGAKTGGEGFYKDGEPNDPRRRRPRRRGAGRAVHAEGAVEACLLVEEGVCTVRDIDLGMMTGAGLDPRRGLLPPFWKADVEGLDTVLERLEQLAERTATASRRR